MDRIVKVLMAIALIVIAVNTSFLAIRLSAMLPQDDKTVIYKLTASYEAGVQNGYDQCMHPGPGMLQRPPQQ
jgi:hypothetical protein